MPWPATSPIAEHDAAVGERDHVVPVAADVQLVPRRHVAAGELQLRQLGQALGQQAALQRLGHAPRPAGALALGRAGDLLAQPAELEVRAHAGDQLVRPRTA